MSSESVVLDSWPVLEWIQLRSGATAYMDALFQHARDGKVLLHMPRINSGEVVYSIRKSPDILEKELAVASFRAAPIHIHSVDDRLVDEAVELKSSYPISYADAFVAALAIRLHAPVVTGDREFRRLEADGLFTLHWVGA